MRRIHLLVATLLALTCLVPGGTSSPRIPPDPHPRILDDAQACLATLGVDPETAGTTTCMVAYIHPTSTETWPMSLEPPPEDTDRYRYPENGSLDRLDFALPPHSVSYHQDGTTLVHPYSLPHTVSFVPGVPLHFQFHFELERGPVDHLTPLPCTEVRLELLVPDPVTGLRPIAAVERTGSIGDPTWPLPPPECPDDEAFQTEGDVTTFTDALSPVNETIENGTRPLLRLTARTLGPFGTPDQASVLLLVQGPDHPNHLVLPLETTILHRSLDATWADGRLLMQSVVEGPLAEEGAARARTETFLVDAEGEPVTGMDHSLQPYPRKVVSWSGGVVRAETPLVTGTLPDGTYRIETQTWNQQKTGRISGSIPLAIGDAGTTLRIDDPSGENRSYTLVETMVESCDCVGPDEGDKQLEQVLSELPAPATLLLVGSLVLLVGRGRAWHRNRQGPCMPGKDASAGPSDR